MNELSELGTRFYVDLLYWLAPASPVEGSKGRVL